MKNHCSTYYALINYSIFALTHLKFKTSIFIFLEALNVLCS
jgi:hypothetical protein